MADTQNWITWVFSGIGTYFIQLVVALLCFIFSFLFIKRKLSKSIKTKIEGDSYSIKQSGAFNKLNIKQNKK